MTQKTNKPLADAMRPTSFSDLIDPTEGYSSLRKLYVLVKQGGLRSVILWGNPGTGKTTTALLIAKELGTEARVLSAVSHGVKDIRAVIEDSSAGLALSGQPILLVMDEIHRLNRAQQDSLLPALESGSIRMVGATTENPSFNVNNAVLSRSLVFKLDNHSLQSLVRLLKKAQEKRGNFTVSEDLIVTITHYSDGDARKALTFLEYFENILLDTQYSKLSPEELIQLFPEKVTRYDRDGDMHYDVISAFIKSIRASQPDAATYYLARMIDSGEDPRFIARRLCISASEDIGLADSQGLVLATAGLQACESIGMPEARIILGHVTQYLARAPKSNLSYSAINQALEDVKNHGSLEVPLHLRNASSELAKQMGYGKSYKNPHFDPEGAAASEYLPKGL